MRLVFRVKSLYGLKDEGVNNLLVIIPVQTLFLENVVKVRIILYQGSLYFPPYFPVCFVGVVLVDHVFLIYKALLNLVA